MLYELYKGSRLVEVVDKANVAYRWYVHTYHSAVYRLYPDGSRVLWLARG